MTPPNPSDVMTIAFEIAMIACKLAEINVEAGGSGGPSDRLHEAAELLEQAYRLSVVRKDLDK